MYLAGEDVSKIYGGKSSISEGKSEEHLQNKKLYDHSSFLAISEVAGQMKKDEDLTAEEG